MTTNIDDDAVETDPAYAFKPSLLGGAAEFMLRPDALEWQIGRRSGRVRYAAIQAVRLSYRPVTMQMHRFVTEIWCAGHPKMQIVSVSWRNMMQQQRQDAAYAGFVTELHRRVAAAGGAARFTAGLPIVTYCVGVVVFTVVMVATGALVVRATSLDRWAPLVTVAIFFLVFAYQLGNYFYRNRPVGYRPDAIPPGVLPKL